MTFIGMTETSPASFMTSVDDDSDDKLSTVGKILPHMTAKVVSRQGDIVDRGIAGELWVSGYNVHVGYFNDPHKTKEAIVKDADGTAWMQTGDEVVIDQRGFCVVTGRINDIIIRGKPSLFK